MPDERFNNGIGPSNIEKDNLEAHVELCHQRYRQMSARLTNIENKVSCLHEDVIKGQKSMTKVLITTAGTIVAGVLSTLVVVIVAFI